MPLSADNWLRTRYADPTCGGDGIVNVGITRQVCPDCKGSGLNERRIEEDAAKGLIPKWVLDQRTIKQR